MKGVGFIFLGWQEWSHLCQWPLVVPVWLAAALRLLGGIVPGRRGSHPAMPRPRLCCGRSSHLGIETDPPRCECRVGHSSIMSDFQIFPQPA